jgi:hypothetical protein
MVFGLFKVVFGVSEALPPRGKVFKGGFIELEDR